MIDISSDGLNWQDETMKEPSHPSPIANEPIYAIVRKDKTSVKKSPMMHNENIPKHSGVHDGFSHINANCVTTASTNLGIPNTSSFKLNTILNNWKKKTLKSCPPQPMVPMNINLEAPPPLPDKLFDIDMEVNSAKRHPKEVSQAL